jgi:hypothetical protein
MASRVVVVSWHVSATPPFTGNVHDSDTNNIPEVPRDIHHGHVIPWSGV